MTDEHAPSAEPTPPTAPPAEEEVNLAPLITVVVSCDNQGEHLQESVESLLVQTYDNLEIIIVNDGSTDNSKAVAESLTKLDPKVRLIDFPEHKGKWNALNTAIADCKGLIVVCQDAGDVSVPDRIRRQFDTMVATNSVHSLCGLRWCTDEELATAKLERHEGVDLKGLEAQVVGQMVEQGFLTPGIDAYYTADFQTAGAGAMFIKALWNIGFKFLPPDMGLRVSSSEMTDFNTRVTLALRNTTVLAESLYLTRKS